jgi:hypothetical protein
MGETLKITALPLIYRFEDSFNLNFDYSKVNQNTTDKLKIEI